MAPLLLPVSVWLYTLVEVFAAFWFAPTCWPRSMPAAGRAPVCNQLRVEIELVDGVPMRPTGGSSASSFPGFLLLPPGTRLCCHELRPHHRRR